MSRIFTSSREQPRYAAREVSKFSRSRGCGSLATSVSATSIANMAAPTLSPTNRMPLGPKATGPTDLRAGVPTSRPKSSKPDAVLDSTIISSCVSTVFLVASLALCTACCHNHFGAGSIQIRGFSARHSRESRNPGLSLEAGLRPGPGTAESSTKVKTKVGGAAGRRRGGSRSHLRAAPIGVGPSPAHRFAPS